MARFLFTIWPFPGHIHPNVAIAKALANAGHEIAFYSGQSAQVAIESEQFRFFPFQRVDDKNVNATVQKMDELSLKWWQAGQQKALLKAWLIDTAESQIQDLESVLNAWRPDVLVCDPAMWGPLLVLQESKRIPLAIMSYVAACMLPGDEGPIVGLPLRRPHNGLSRFKYRLLRSIAHIASRKMRLAADALRARHQLAPIKTSVTAFGGQMPLYLVASTALFDRRRTDLPPSVHYVGPCTWDKPVSESPPSWLTQLPRDRALIYVTEGTLHSKEPKLLLATLDGLATKPVYVVATTGKHRKPADLELVTQPANAVIKQWVPHSDLFPKVDLVITTGGTGTVLAALAHGVPLIIAPTAWDQPHNAMRVEEAGAGIWLKTRQCQPSRISEAVDLILNDASYKKNAERLAVDLNQHSGATRASELLQALAYRQPLFEEDNNVVHRRERVSIVASAENALVKTSVSTSDVVE